MKKLSLVVALMGACALIPAAQAQEQILIKFSHVVAADTPKGKAAEFFKKLAEERTQGRVRVEVYHNSALYKDREEMEALQLGAVHMLAPSLAKFGPLGIREFEVFDIPYILDGYEALHKVTRGPVGAKLLALLEPKGIIGLGYWDNGFKIMSANKPIRMPADMRGMKVRIQSSRVLDAQMRALRAMPQVMSFSEVYQALQTGVVDGTENPPSNMFTQKMHEVQKHATLTNHGYLGYAVIVNKRFWEGLPADIREILEQAMRETNVYNDEIAKKDNDDALEGIRASGRTQIHTPTEAERKAWIDALMPVHKTVESRVGKEIIQDFYKATGRQ